MRFKLDRQCIKYYTYAVLGVITIILFYKILDNFGLILSTIASVIGAAINMVFPIILGAIVAYFLFRPMYWLQRRMQRYIRFFTKKPKLTRILAVLITYSLTLLVLSVFMSISVPAIIDSILGLVNKLPEYGQEINDFLKRMAERGGFFREIFSSITFDIDMVQKMTAKDLLDFMGTGGLSFTSESVKQIGNIAVIFAKGTTNFLISGIAVFFSSFYLMLDKENIQKQLNRFNRAVMNDKIYNGFYWVIGVIDDLFYKYFSGKIMTSALIGLICYGGLLILRVDYAPLIALIVGVTNVIPYFGPIIGAVPGIFLTLLYNPIMAISVAIWIFIVQQFDGNFLGPNVLGKIVELSPFWVLVSVLVGGSLLGPLGMFIAIPFFGVVRVVLNAGLEQIERKKGILVSETHLSENEPDETIKK